MAATSRSIVRMVRRFLKWLAAVYEVPFASEVLRVSEYLQVRLSELSGRGALKNTQSAMVSLEEASGIDVSARLTSSAFFTVIKNDILANALFCSFPRQAPKCQHYLVSLLDAAPMLATLRFADNRGLDPKDMSIVAESSVPNDRS